MTALFILMLNGISLLLILILFLFLASRNEHPHNKDEKTKEDIEKIKQQIIGKS